MSCGSKYHTGSCVADILKEIVSAQDNIAGDCCDTSCERSIAELLGDTQAPTNLDTVPVLLYCKDCTPFKGYGAPFNAIADVVGSFYFRVKKVDSKNCAVLELLRTPNDPEADPVSPVTQFTANLQATGICITVDLDCFCHVTCLPPITAL